MKYIIFGLLALSITPFLIDAQPLNTKSSPQKIDFNKDIRPILNSKCAKCHGGVKRKGGFSILYRSEVLAKAKSGDIPIVVGKPDQSELINRITHSDPDEIMPPSDSELKLSKVEIQKLTQWIKEGANYVDHWAYVKPKKSTPPTVKQKKWISGTIDRYILARLEKEGLKPEVRASKETLIRRLSLDLIGLPPTLEELDNYLKDKSPKATEKIIDRLLASPKFGERWATMWLDLARYADTNGYEKDAGRTIYDYRDWVIKAFNRDLPYDQFTIDQIGGDLLKNPTPQQLVATGFHRNTMRNTEGGVDKEEFRTYAVFDRVNTTWVTWMGTSFGCVQCHGHPYDPFKNEEYYKFMDYFNSSPNFQIIQTPYVIYTKENLKLKKQYDKEIKNLSKFLKYPSKEMKKKVLKSQKIWEVFVLGDSGHSKKKRKKTPKDILKIVKTAAGDRSKKDIAKLEKYYYGISKERRSVLKDINLTKSKINRIKPTVKTLTMKDLPKNKMRETKILIKGNFLDQGKKVKRGLPKSLHAMPKGAPDNRLGIAQWLVSPENPLTARVAVNRYWEQLFGFGLVETLEDFGTQGSAPSHFKLLDYLALKFQNDYKWSMKKIIKEIVMSSTYQQSSKITPAKLAKDPRNILLSRGARVRLSAEQIRDQALFIGGILSSKMYGPGVYPPQPAGMPKTVYNSSGWRTSKGEDAHRRAIYTLWKRTTPYPSMISFDKPSREFCVARRIRTNTPLQALISLNDPVYVEAAKSLASRILKGKKTDEDRIRLAYRISLSRQPKKNELKIMLAFYQGELKNFKKQKQDAKDFAGEPHLAAWTLVGTILLNLDECITKR